MESIINTKNKSSLEFIFNRLSVKSKESIINEDEFNNFNKYMHIDRPIQYQLEEDLYNYLFTSNNKSIVFIVGNVGDGKSHLLSYMTNKYKDEIRKNNIVIHNDATETSSPNKTAMETLLDLISPFSDTHISNSGMEKLIIAINLGVLTNLTQYLNKIGNYQILLDFLNKSGIINSKKEKHVSNKYFKITSFIGESHISSENSMITSNFYKEALRKVYSKDGNNPFYKAYLNDLNKGIYNISHNNYEILLNKSVQESIIYILIRSEIEYKSIISARSLFNFFYDITISKEDNIYGSLPYLIFENSDKSDLLNIIADMDPILNNTKEMDRIAIDLYHSQNYYNYIKIRLTNNDKPFINIINRLSTTKYKYEDYLKMYLRLEFMANHLNSIFDNSLYFEYLDIYMNILETQEEKKIYDKRILKLIGENYYKWNGDLGQTNKIVKNPLDSRIKILINSKIKPKNQRAESGDIIIIYSIGSKSVKVSVDYRTFKLLNKIDRGYILKSEDRKLAINFDRFVNSILSISERKNEEIDIYNIKSGEKFMLIKENWGDYRLERIVNG